jgi:fimbrial chaperone protein
MTVSVRLAAALAVACALAAAAGAASFKLYPVRIVLSPAQPVQTMVIHNNGTEPVRAQLRVFAWSQAGGNDAFTETRDVLANPPIFEVPPGGDQIARFGLRTAPGPTEKSYRVFVQEVPSDRPRKAGEIQTLLRISVPIFVPAPGAVGKLEWRLWPSGEKQATLAIRNLGGAHVELNRVELRRNGKPIAAKDMSVYLLPGSARRLTFDVATSPGAGETIALMARTDEGKLSTSIVSEAPPRETGRH